METRIREIVALQTTKTARIRQLITLGVARTRIAELLTNGNYGQVQNVYTKMVQEGLIERIGNTIRPSEIAINSIMTPRAFDKQFGVELECYNASQYTLQSKLVAAGVNCIVEGYNHSTRSHWKIVSDSSIRGSQAFELVSPILQGEAGITELMKVCKVLRQCGAKVNSTCGTHVHINARNFTIDQWKRIYINYARLEKVIDKTMPASRRGNTNQYCKGFTSITNYESRINTATTLNGIASGIFNGSRYWKVNPQSYSRHNTVEFRQHSGTTDFIKLATWIRFLSNLVDYSENNLVTDKTLDGLRAFNSIETVEYLKYRTLELA